VLAAFCALLGFFNFGPFREKMLFVRAFRASPSATRFAAHTVHYRNTFRTTLQQRFNPTVGFASIAGESIAAQNDAASNPIKVPLKFVPRPFSYRQEVDIKIETLTNRGLGIGRVELSDDQVKALEQPRQETSSKRSRRSSKSKEKEDDPVDLHDNGKPNQWVIMVPAVIPGEVVRVSVYRNFRNYSEADLLEILEKSPDRITPFCPLAGDCGGCQLQHMSIESQRRMKTQQVEENLKQYKIDNVSVEPCLGTAEVFGYRSKLTPHYDYPVKSRRGRKNVGPAQIDDPDVKRIEAIGFQKQASRQLIDIPQCPIGTPEVNVAYATLREKLLSEPPTRKKGATLLLRQANIGDEHVETDHHAFLTTTVRGLDFSYRAGNFFQNNYYVLPLMVDHVVKEATRGDDMTHLADCYCGSGLFAISAAAHFKKVVGIEINDKAIAEATANAKKNDITNCEFQAASAENIFSVIQDFPRDTTAVVLDPPRKGCSTDFLNQLLDFAPRRIVYMSCDATTQARDAVSLVAEGAYRITAVQPFDLFPQTRHIECLMILERNNT